MNIPRYIPRAVPSIFPVFVLGLFLSAAARSEAIGDAHWLVKPGDTVYSIARKVFPGEPRKQARFRRELVQKNPRVFRDNANLMEVGSRLTLPEFAIAEKVEDRGIKPVKKGPAPKPAQPAPQTEKIADKTPQAATPDPEEVVGRVLIKIGKLEASNRGSTRILNRNSKILRGDTLSTSRNTRTQIRMKDGALISLQPETRLRLAEYRYNGVEDGTESSLLELIRGGFRTITGAIGHKNKHNYRVKTSIATIGIRGTHYGLILCTAGSCSGGDQGVLEDGLYGGVIDGAIMTENNTGIRQFNNDQYFHIPSPRTPPVEILLPPPVFQDLHQAGPLARDLRGDVPEGPAGELIAETDTPEADMRNVRERNVREGFAEMTRRDRRLPDFAPNDFDRDPIPLVLPQDEQEVTQTAYTLPTIVKAPNGSGMLLGFNTLETNSGSGTTVGSAGAPVIVPGRFGGNAIYLSNQVYNGYTINNLPFGGHEDGLDSDGNLQSHELAMERPDGSGASLVALNRNVALDVIWGRWAGPFLVFENGNLLPHTQNLHFIYSDNLTTPSNLGGISSRSQLYKTIDGTLPTDHLGNVGSGLPNIWASIDFQNQQLTAYSVSATVGSSTYSAALTDPVAFSDLDHGFGIYNAGGCVNGCDGEASLVFAGTNAGGAMTSYSMHDLVLAQGVSGAALLAPITDPQAPDDSAALYAFNDQPSNGIFSGQIIATANRADNIYLTAYNDGTNHFVPEVMIETTALPSQLGRTLLFDTTNISTDMGSTFGEATSITDYNTNTVNVTVNWGRWNATAATIVESGQEIAHNDVHFIHSRNLTPLNVLTDGTLAAIHGVTPVPYSTVDGTLPTDSAGSVGSVPGTVNMNVNFSAQQIEWFSVSASAGASAYSVEMDTVNPVSFSNLANGIPMREPSVGSCSGGSLCTGTARLNFIGPQAEGAITSYIIGESDGSNTITGTALLSQGGS